MEIDATTETIMTDEVMTEQPPAAAAAAAMEMEEDDAPPARLMITKMVRFNPIFAHRHHSSRDTSFLTELFAFSLSLSYHHRSSKTSNPTQAPKQSVPSTNASPP